MTARSIALSAFFALTFSFLTKVQAEIRFARDIQPLLSDHCYTCHGPDANQRKADFRLDLKEEALKERDGSFAIVPGDIDQSELVHRIQSKDLDDVMPPPDANLALSSTEIALIRQWISEGAQWEEHWAFDPPTRQEIPPTRDTQWARNPIDHFVLNNIDKQRGLVPSDEAEPEALLRRVTLDLTGLPPSLSELDNYLDDPAATRYENAVDRLLSSEAYAERMALEWMDVARYADSHGMHADGWRMMWPWRDWVINAFKTNQPYDEFVTWQIAGDLFPDPTDDQIIATAFHRNHAMTAEGGIVDEEFRIQYVFDRAQTTATAFLGMTLECARCHDHKFDPLSQKDYYRMTAFFNNLNELGMTGDDGNYGPMHLIKTSEQGRLLASIEEQIHFNQGQIKTSLTKVTEPQAALSVAPPLPSNHFPFDSIEFTGEKKNLKRVDGNDHASLSGSPEIVPGLRAGALRFDSEYDIVSLKNAGLYDSDEPFSVSAWIRPDTQDQIQSIIGNAGAKNNFWRGWDFHIDSENRVALRLIHSLPHSHVHVRTQSTISRNEWTQVAFSYDGSSSAEGVVLYINGSQDEKEILYDRLHKSIYPVSGNANRDREDRALRVGKAYRSFTGEYGIFSGLIDEIRIWGQSLTAAEHASSYNTDLSEAALSAKPVTLSSKQLAIHHHIRSDPEHRAIQAKLTALYQERLESISDLPEIMVMKESHLDRKTFVLNRGQYNEPTTEVTASTPAAILPFPKSYPQNRLGLAKWLFHPDNPLPARVTVNRYWQLFFGRGLVATSEDFGIQGSRPSHPDLLDWLALEFRDSGWNLKQLHKLIVTSATYRQTSRTTDSIQRIDPLNIHLSRGPRHRLPAELIRDQALSMSGLLVSQLGGPSVKPYQPKGLWIDKGNFSAKLLRYKPDTGDKLYRRSLYTFIRRTSPHPAMVAFDAPNRDICQVRRENTNTPLQALVLMNDPQFIEAARVFAERIQEEGGNDLGSQIDFAFRTVTSRAASVDEKAVLRNLLEHEIKRFGKAPEEAKALLSTGSHPINPKFDEVRTAALAIMANTLFNHDDFYTKR